MEKEIPKEITPLEKIDMCIKHLKLLRKVEKRENSCLRDKKSYCMVLKKE